MKIRFFAIIFLFSIMFLGKGDQIKKNKKMEGIFTGYTKNLTAQTQKSSFDQERMNIYL